VRVSAESLRTREAYFVVLKKGQPPKPQVEPFMRWIRSETGDLAKL
jgi:hypothetical protein